MCLNNEQIGVIESSRRGDWPEAKAVVEGMLAEPWHLIGYQEDRLREFLELLQREEGGVARQKDFACVPREAKSLL